MIRGTGLCKSFGDEQILRDVDVHLKRGRILGIVGPGGVGKSVLVKLLAGLITPDEGSVVVDGQDLADLSFDEMATLRGRFGMLFQNYALFDFMTVGENIAFPLEQRGDVSADEIRERVTARLAEVDLPGVERLYANELSGGMKKRVALARATIARAPILLYDDPTAGLDPVTSSKIFRLIARLHDEQGATLIVGHDVDRMRVVCNDWVMLYEGRVHFSGTSEEAMASDDPIVRVFFHGSEDAPNVGQGGPT